MSSIAVAGLYDDGIFTEDMFDEGQKLAHPYHRTKFESEKLVRERVKAPIRIYRPCVVVGDSRTGEMDKIDGPVLLLQGHPEGPARAAGVVPADLARVGLDEHRPGRLRRRRRRPHRPRGRPRRPDLPRRRPQGPARRRGAEHVRRGRPRAQGRDADRQARDAEPAQGRDQLRAEAAGAQADPREPPGRPRASRTRSSTTSRSRCRFDARDTQRALRGSDIAIPPLAHYAEKLWDYWERELDPDLYKDRCFEGAVNGKTVVITGASTRHRPRRGAEDRGRRRHPDPRRPHQGEARRGQGRDRGRGRHRLRRPVRPQRLRRDRQAGRDAAGRARRRSTCWSTTRAARSAAASRSATTASTTTSARSTSTTCRPCKLMLGLLPHMRDQGGGHVVNVSSIGVQTNPPRFSAYVGTKAALDAFTRVVSSETIGDNVTFTTIHMPLVRTPMIAPTKMYDSFPTISPEEAADLVCEAIRAKPKQINTKLGTFGEVAYALAPKAVDQILHLAYRVFPESTAAKGGKGDDAQRQGLGRGDRARLSDEGRALVVLTRRRAAGGVRRRGRDGVPLAAPRRRGAAGRRPRPGRARRPVDHRHPAAAPVGQPARRVRLRVRRRGRRAVAAARPTSTSRSTGCRCTACARRSTAGRCVERQRQAPRRRARLRRRRRTSRSTIASRSRPS